MYPCVLEKRAAPNKLFCDKYLDKSTIIWRLAEYIGFSIPYAMSQVVQLLSSFYELAPQKGENPFCCC